MAITPTMTMTLILGLTFKVSLAGLAAFALTIG